MYYLMTGTLGALPPEAVLAIQCGLRSIHFVGLVLGLGAATLLDLIILRFLARGQVSAENAHIVEFSSKVVTVGLVFLWISGAGFLAHYAAFDPAKLGNPKIWAKISIVAILTLNGVFIHRTVLPVVRNNIGRSLFTGLDGWQRSRLLIAGAVSGTSWYVPMLLGTFPQLNFVVPASTILLAYAAMLMAAILATHGIARVFIPRVPTVTLPRDEYESLIGLLKELRESASHKPAPTPALRLRKV